MSDFTPLIREITKAAHLSTNQQRDLEKELCSHFAAAEHELAIQGLPEEKIAEEITRRFGNPTQIGQQLATVYEGFPEWLEISMMLLFIALTLMVIFLGAASHLPNASTSDIPLL